MPRFAMEHVYKTYPGEVLAIRDFSLQSTDGELIILHGPSKSGKTTILRLIAGLERISDGQILLDDEPIHHMPARERPVAMIFRQHPLYKHMTMYDNMSVGLRLRNASKQEIDQGVKEAAALLNAQHLLPRRSKGISLGQLQRVSLVRAISRKPKLLLIEAPDAPVNDPVRIQMRADIHTIRKAMDITVLYATDSEEEAQRMDGRIVEMRQGNLLKAE